MSGTTMRARRPIGPIGAGVKIARYEVLGEIASGGMAKVYIARALATAGFERLVALKICHEQFREDHEFVEMFFNEARLAARIHHPNVVPVLDVGDEPVLFLVMEYIEGERLSDLIRASIIERTEVPLPVALRILTDMLNGLHAAHELKDARGQPLNVVHRDVSPQNVLVGVDGSTRLTDFGVAKAEARASITRDGQLKVKIGYMAPEQLAGESSIDRRVDVFAAGIVAWELLCRRRLFMGDSDAEIMNRILRSPIESPSSLHRDVPAALDAAISKALERSITDRHASAREFAVAIERCGVPIASVGDASEFVRTVAAERLALRAQLVSGARATVSPTLDVLASFAPIGSEPNAFGTPSIAPSHESNSDVRIAPLAHDPPPSLAPTSPPQRSRGPIIAASLAIIAIFAAWAGYRARTAFPVQSVVPSVTSHVVVAAPVPPVIVVPSSEPAPVAPVVVVPPPPEPIAAPPSRDVTNTDVPGNTRRMRTTRTTPVEPSVVPAIARDAGRFEPGVI